MSAPSNPALYQINTRVVLQERGAALGRPATLDDFEDRFLDDIAAKGFDWVWLLGVWQMGPVARAISRSNPKLVAECRNDLPDLREEDITGSPFAIVAYDVSSDFGGNRALARFRERLGARGLKLLLDFVPNHTAPDHPWVAKHPEYYIHGSEQDLASQPQNYIRVSLPGRKTAILAHGRDPYFDGWPDTLQLNYRHAGFREARIAELGSIAERCDGVRCDMAMLLQPQIIQRTWGDRSRPADGSPPKDNPFWDEAIRAVKRRHPGFLFVAEVYWDMEWELQQAGFDYTYDKRLYDRLHAQAATPVREHLTADPAFQQRSLRFLENHDEPRAAAAFPKEVHQAAAVIALLSRGLRFIHEGQIEGRRVHVSMHLGRRPAEPVDEDLQAFYWRLLECMRRPEVRDGDWRLEDCRPAWAGNPTSGQLVVASWQLGERRLITAVNYGPSQAQGYVTFHMNGLEGRSFTLVDLLSEAQYRRAGDELAAGGLYLDMLPWGRQVFELRIN
ncbi:MAG TPA: alpha-amylase family glycosyl hydrolase [Polyangia bacterium]|nr:alpha-amylase family glycosyl hydrolase [Polyangia bacterium]